jgi:hypothetical protein
MQAARRSDRLSGDDPTWAADVGAEARLVRGDSGRDLTSGSVTESHPQ